MRRVGWDRRLGLPVPVSGRRRGLRAGAAGACRRRSFPVGSAVPVFARVLLPLRRGQGVPFSRVLALEWESGTGRDPVTAPVPRGQEPAEWESDLAHGPRLSGIAGAQTPQIGRAPRRYARPAPAQQRARERQRWFVWEPSLTCSWGLRWQGSGQRRQGASARGVKVKERPGAMLLPLPRGRTPRGA